MKTLGNLPIVKDENVNYPFGANIQNETDTEDGTPVVREIYGDIIMNLYKLLDLTNIVPTEDEDNDSSQYQIIDAIKKLANSYNDIEQVLTLTTTVWSVPFDLSILPDKYVFFARPTDNYISGETYTFEGTGIESYSFTSPTGYNASDEVLIVIDQSEVRAYSLTNLNENAEVFTVFGTPLSFNDSAKIYYQEGGSILTDDPSVGYLENVIRVAASDGALIVNEMFILKSKIVCVVYDPTQITYRFFSFPINDFATTTEITVTGGSIPIGSDFTPYFYCNGENIYITNTGGSTVNDYELEVYLFDEVGNELTYTSLINLEATFIKSTNAVIKNTDIFTLISGQLNRFSLSGAMKTEIGYFNGTIGNLFAFDEGFYFSSGEVAKKWAL